MNANDMFLRFCEKNRCKAQLTGAFSFGADADALAELVLQGKKTATSSAFACYEAEREPLPRAGQYFVVLNSRNEAVCVIRTTLVYVCSFDKVAPLHAAKEGEGDGSLSYWRQVHEAFFTHELQSIGQHFSRKIPVVCEEFEVAYKEETE